MPDKPLIPDSWAPHIVAMSLSCDVPQAEAFLAEHESDPDGLLMAVERESARRSLAWIESLAVSLNAR